PMSVILHALNLGGMFDEGLVWFLNLRLPSTNLGINFWVFLAYNVCALISIRSRNLAIFLVVINLFCFAALL
ncbi:MAG: ComEC/Rec2 family competence protein, partial [Campylobacter sp.]|nr:ComEC/Rec2 family competence protein [Campylobacter sp.]